jgi:hypothetical protein
MKSKKNNNEIPSPEEFWPEAKVLLDGHFAKRKRLFLFFGMSLVLIVSIIGFVFTNQKNTAPIISLNKTKTELKYNQKQATPAKPKNIKETNKEATFAGKNYEQTSIIHNQPSFKKSNDNSSSNTLIFEKRKQPKTKIENKNQHTKNDDIDKSYINDHLIIASTANAKNSNILNLNEDKTALTNSLNASVPNTDEITIEEERKDVKVFSKIPFLSFKMLDQKTVPNVIEGNSDLSNIDDDYFKNKQAYTYFIGAYAGLQLVSKQIKTNQTLAEYADIRNTSEKNISTLFYGINFAVEKKKFILQTGFEYNTIGEQNNYDAKSKQWLQSDEKAWDVYNKQIVKIDTVYRFGIVSYDQTILNVKDSTLLTKADSIFVYQPDNNIAKANVKNTINYIEIPLMIAYQFKIGKASIAPFAGVSVGYVTASNGMYINKSITGIENINDASLITNFNFNYQFKLQLAYNLNDRLMFVCSPQYRSNLFSISAKSSGIITKYSALGTSFGLTYKL